MFQSWNKNLSLQFWIKRQHQSPKAGPKVERSSTDFYNFQNQIIWTKLKITSFRFVLYNLEWRLAAVESVVPPFLYSAYFVPSHMLQDRPRPCTYLLNISYMFLSKIFSYTSESYARTAMSVIDRPCGNVFRSKLKIHSSIKLLEPLHKHNSNLLLHTYMYFKVDALTFFVAW